MINYGIHRKLFWFIDLENTDFTSESDLDYEQVIYNILFANEPHEQSDLFERRYFRYAQFLARI